MNDAFSMIADGAEENEEKELANEQKKDDQSLL